MTETYLPRATAAGARLAVGHRVDRLVLDGAGGPSPRRRRHRPRRATGHGSTFGHVDRVRRGDPDAGPAAALRAAPPHRPRRSPSTRRSSWRPASPTTSTSPDDVPVHQVKEFAPDLSFGGSASEPGPRRAGPQRLTGRRFGDAVDGLAADRRVLRGDHERGTRPRRRRARLARSRRHVPPHPTRPGPARPGPRPARPGAARSRGHRRVPVVPRRADRAVARATWRRCRGRSPPTGPA